MNTEFDNVKIVSRKMPSDLFSVIQKESEEIIQRYKNGDQTRRFMNSGLLDSHGAPIQYHIDGEARRVFHEFSWDLYKEFIDCNKLYMSSQRHSLRSMPYSQDQSWWIIQEKHMYNPIHLHDGIVGYNLWVKIPYKKEEENKTDWSLNGAFQFQYCDILGNIHVKDIQLSSEDEGVMMMFPAMLQHCVYPFYTSDDIRISASGNISFDPDGKL